MYEVLLIVMRDLFRRGVLAFLRSREGGHMRSLYEAYMKSCLLFGGILGVLSRGGSRSYIKQGFI